MNEKLKEAYEQFRHDCWPYDEPPNSLEILAAAARGEIPGFQLVPVEPSDDMTTHARFAAQLSSSHVDLVYAAMLTASREEQK